MIKDLGKCHSYHIATELKIYPQDTTDTTDKQITLNSIVNCKY